MGREQTDIQEIISNKELFYQLKNATVLVTGATGLIGSTLVKAISLGNRQYGLGITVIGQIRNIEKAKSIYGDMYSDIEFVTDPHLSCSHIIHTVSPTSSKFFIEHPVETIKSSVGSILEIMEIAKDNNASVVYLSSMEQYGVPYEVGQRMTEDKIGVIDHLNIRSSYSESKRLCECLCASYAEEYGVDVKIARLAQTFGAGISKKDNRMPMQFAKAAVAGSDIILHTSGRSISNFVYLSDAITGIMTILAKGKQGEAYNVCNDSESRTVKEIAELVAQEIADGRIQVRCEINKNMGYAPDTTIHLDSGKLRKLGWNANVDLKEAYTRMVAYLKGE